MSSEPLIPAWDLHLHAAPSLSPRWADDLDMVDGAGRHGVRGFVLKSHHESTAGRAAIASAYAARRAVDCRVVGSVVLNPWISLVELDRALALGACVVWWPTRDEEARDHDLELPATHAAALDRLAGRPGVLAATGHLSEPAAIRLARECRERAIPLVATHPLNPDIGVGVPAALELAGLGAIVEIDAHSLWRLRESGGRAAPLVRRLGEHGVAMLATSDGGQAATGDPWRFAAGELGRLVADGLEPEVRRLCAEADRVGEMILHAG